MNDIITILSRNKIMGPQIKDLCMLLFDNSELDNYKNTDFYASHDKIVDDAFANDKEFLINNFAPINTHATEKNAFMRNGEISREKFLAQLLYGYYPQQTRAAIENIALKMKAQPLYQDNLHEEITSCIDHLDQYTKGKVDYNNSTNRSLQLEADYFKTYRPMIIEEMATPSSLNQSLQPIIDEITSIQEMIDSQSSLFNAKKLETHFKVLNHLTHLKMKDTDETSLVSYMSFYKKICLCMEKESNDAIAYIKEELREYILSSLFYLEDVFNHIKTSTQLSSHFLLHLLKIELYFYIYKHLQVLYDEHHELPTYMSMAQQLLIHEFYLLPQLFQDLQFQEHQELYRNLHKLIVVPLFNDSVLPTYYPLSSYQYPQFERIIPLHNHDDKNPYQLFNKSDFDHLVAAYQTHENHPVLTILNDLEDCQDLMSLISLKGFRNLNNDYKNQKRIDQLTDQFKQENQNAMFHSDDIDIFRSQIQSLHENEAEYKETILATTIYLLLRFAVLKTPTKQIHNYKPIYLHDIKEYEEKVIHGMGAIGFHSYLAIKKLAKDGNMIACYDMAEYHYYGYHRVKQDYNLAYHYYSLSADKGYSKGLWGKGYCLYHQYDEDLHIDDIEKLVSDLATQKEKEDYLLELTFECQIESYLIDQNPFASNVLGNILRDHQKEDILYIYDALKELHLSTDYVVYFKVADACNYYYATNNLALHYYQEGVRLTKYHDCQGAFDAFNKHLHYLKKSYENYNEPWASNKLGLYYKNSGFVDSDNVNIFPILPSDALKRDEMIRACFTTTIESLRDPYVAWALNNLMSYKLEINEDIQDDIDQYVQLLQETSSHLDLQVAQLKMILKDHQEYLSLFS